LQRYDAAEILVHPHTIHDRDAAVARHEKQLAAIVLPVDGDEGAAARTRNKASALPSACNAIGAHPAQPRSVSLDAPRLAGRHAGDETLRVSRIELPIASRGEHRRAACHEADADCAIARVS